ncbi:procyclic acidic repetitive family protein [uncultured Rothia sp.]|uniref:procyclic acidic repetitive family protein n=1 Tax=uncultured Rothia sp. TaxID=316088 RepID=UPI002620682E|nr:procyclic acidic repetitive family protein [uncultured Rothia sp.]
MSKSYKLRSVMAAAVLVPAVGLPAALANESPSPVPSPSASASPSAPPVVGELPVLEVTVADQLVLEYPGFEAGESVVFVVRDDSGRSVYSVVVRVTVAGSVRLEVPVGSLGVGEYTVSATAAGHELKDQRVRVREAVAPTVEPTAEPEPTKSPEPSAEPSVEPTKDPEPVPSEQPTAEPTKEPEPTKSPEPTAEPSVKPVPVPIPVPVPSVAPTKDPEPVPSEQPTSAPSSSSAEPSEQPSVRPDEPVPSVGTVNTDPESRKKEQEQKDKEQEKVDPHVEVIRPSASASASSGAGQDASAVAAEREAAEAARQAPAVEPGDSSALVAEPISRSSVVAADSEKVSGSSVVAAPISRGGSVKDQDAGKDVPVAGAPSRDASSSPEPSVAVASPSSSAQVEPATDSSWGWFFPVAVIGLVAGAAGWFLVMRRRKGASS